MELHLFILLFLTGGISLSLSIPRKYYLIQQEKTWSEAQAYCRSTYTDLATIETADDMIRLQAEAQKHRLSSTAWTGLWNDINNWRWSFGNEPLGNWTDWGATEPNNLNGQEECGGTNQNNWFDTSCATPFPFLCLDDSQIGSARNIYYPDLKTWHEAQTFCRHHHTDLAKPINHTENSAIKQHLRSLPGSATAKMNTFFGLFRRSWMWSDQTNFSTVAWMPGQPDNKAGNETCGYVSNGVVADAPCSEIKPFFCHQVVTGQQQILRVKVQSNQVVNDPAVKAAILEQIKQKLKSQFGMENATVKWREQPHGVLFHKTKEENTTVALNTTRAECKVKIFS